MLTWTHEGFVSAMALTLLHSLWQGALIGLLGLALDTRLKHASPDRRCGAFSLLLLTFFALWLGTFCGLYEAQTHLAATTAGVPAGSFLPGFFHQPVMSVTPGITSDLATVPPQPSLLQSILHSVFLPLVACWTLGVCVLLLRHIGGFLLLHRLSRTATIPCPPAWEDYAARLAARMGIRRKIRLLCSMGIDVPFAFGLFPSSILLPFSAMTGLAPEQVEALIAHELAHLARQDVLLNLVQVCMETILFYHPVVRWLSTQIRAAREQHCDDLAIQAIGDRALYARALFSLEEARASTPHLALGAKGDTSAMTNTHLLRRIRRVLGVSTPERRDPWIKGTLALGAATLGLAIYLPVHAYSPAPGNKPTNAPSANQPATAQASGGTGTSSGASSGISFRLDINGDKIELSGTALTPDTLLKVNGKAGRFGDLTPQQQRQLREAMKNVSASSSSMSFSSTTTPQGTTYRLDLNGDKIEFHTAALTPDTPVTVNGEQVLFGDLTPPQQKQLEEAMQNVSAAHTQSLAAKAAHGENSGPTAQASGGTGTSSGASSGISFRLDINGDKIELSGTALTPDTLLKVNGKAGRFGDLTPQQQRQLREAMKNVSASSSSMSFSSTTTPQGTTYRLDLNGDKIEFHTAALTPDTPVTVNGEQVLFGDLTPPQQKQLQEAVKNVSASATSSTTKTP